MEHVEPLLQEPAKGVSPPPLWMFALLVLPYAVYSNGFLNTVAAAILTREGMSLDSISSMLALLLLPASLYFLWSPLVDFWLRRRTWVAVASAVAGGLMALALQAPRLGAAGPRALLMLGMVVVMLTSCGVGGLMAAVVPVGLKSRASAYFNAGSLGFGALSGGGLLWLSQHSGRREFGLACGLLVAAPGLLALMIEEAPVTAQGETLGGRLLAMGKEFKSTFLRWQALPVLLMLCSPLGSGAALGLLPGMAPSYGVNENMVAALNGVAGGLLSALGALLVGYVKLPLDMRPVYAAAGLLNALTLGILLLGAPRPATYIAATALFALTVGACYALFTALVLQLLGISGKSGGSRYAIALSLGNAPIALMTKVDGLGSRFFGLKGLPATDLTVSGTVALLFLGWFWWERRKSLP